MTTTMTESPEPRTLNHRSLSPHNPDNVGKEKFPSFDENANFHLNTHQNSTAVTESPAEITPAQLPFQDFKWPARKSSQGLREGRNAQIYTHRPRRSVSNAINKFRTRQGSVSENAQELAEALKAPISYKLIVSLEPLRRCHV
jgi:hypothetical protein